jgi:hypothetical protein
VDLLIKGKIYIIIPAGVNGGEVKKSNKNKDALGEYVLADSRGRVLGIPTMLVYLFQSNNQ